MRRDHHHTDAFDMCDWLEVFSTAAGDVRRCRDCSAIRFRFAGFVGQLTLTEFRSLREAVRSFDLRGVPAGFGDEEFAMIGFPHRGVALAIGRDQVDAFAGLLDGALLLLHCDGLLTAHSPPFEPTRDDPACDEPHD